MSGLRKLPQIFTGDLPVAIANFNFWNILAFNLIWTFTNVPIHVIIGVLIAVLLNTKGLWFKSFYRAIYVSADRDSLAGGRRRLAQHVRLATIGAINQMLSSDQPVFGGDSGDHALARSS